MSSSRVRSVERGLDILAHVAAANAPVTTAEIADALALPKSTAYHLVNVLAQRGFLVHLDGPKAWAIGSTAFAVGSRYVQQGSLEEEARPLLTRLTGELGMASHLAVLQGAEVLYLAKRERPGPGVKLVTEVGSRLPAQQTAVGRAALAHLPAEEVRARFEGLPWEGRDGDASSYGDLVDILSLVRARGYAVERGNTTEGITCAAAPLRIGTAVVGSLGVAFVDSGRSDAELASIGETVRAVAGEFGAPRDSGVMFDTALR